MYIYIYILYINIAATKSPCKLNKSDIFCIGNSQIQVLDMKVETPEQIQKRETMAFQRVEMLWKNVSLLSLLPKEIFTKVADALKPVVFNKGDCLLVQGEIGTKFYIIKSGKVEIVYNNKGEKTRLRVCGANDAIGELSIISHTSYSASAIAMEKVVCLSLDSVSFINFVGPYIGTISEEAKKRDMDSIVDLLSKFQLFETLSNEVRVKLANVVYHKTFHDKDYITREGASGDDLEFYIIISGTVRITKRADINSTLAMLNGGDFLGEASLLTGNPRNADAVAVGLVETLALSRENFDSILKEYFANDLKVLERNNLKPNFLAKRKLSTFKPLNISEVTPKGSGQISRRARASIANLGSMASELENSESYLSDEELQLDGDNVNINNVLEDHQNVVKKPHV